MALPRGAMFVIVVFPDHTHLLFLVILCLVIEMHAPCRRDICTGNRAGSEKARNKGGTTVGEFVFLRLFTQISVC